MPRKNLCPLGVKVQVSEEGDQVEGYNIHIGGGFGPDAMCGREIFHDVKAKDAPKTVERMLKGLSRSSRLIAGEFPGLRAAA